jgi:hypothetical protein
MSSPPTARPISTPTAGPGPSGVPRRNGVFEVELPEPNPGSLLSRLSPSTALCLTSRAPSESPSTAAVLEMPHRHPIRTEGRLSAAPPTSGGIPRRCERPPPGGISLRWRPAATGGPETLCDGGRCATNWWNRQGVEGSFGGCWTGRRGERTGLDPRRRSDRHGLEGKLGCRGGTRHAEFGEKVVCVRNSPSTLRSANISTSTSASAR